jgi:tRNA nucleotidyltransferase/poly(A) polymerase
MLKNKRTMQVAGLLSEVEYKFHIEISEPIRQIYNAFTSKGKKLYVVGGAVRDALLGKTPKDFDLATDAIPTDVQKILTDAGIQNFPKGESFGVISAIIDNEEFELATFRSEDYTDGDGRRPNADSIAFTDMATDVSRRDLTINALYYDIEAGMIIDLVGGIEDLQNKRIRTVGHPMDRFSEDRLRAIRSIRFAHRFGSNLDKATIDAIIHFKELPGVSAERIRDEFLKALHSSQKPEEFINDYIKLGLMPRTFPGLEIDTQTVSNIRNPILIVAKLLSKNDVQKVVKGLYSAKFTGDEIESIAFLLELKARFQDFDKLVFDPAVDGFWFMNLIRKKEIILEKGLVSFPDFLNWAKISTINVHLMSSFLSFKPKFSAKDFPNLPQGKELGAKIAFENSNYFLQQL